MASKQVTDRQKSADSVIAAGETHADLVQEELTRLVKPLLKPGESPPDYATPTRKSCALLAAARDRMVQADAAHTAELGDDDAVRAARDTTQAALKQELIDLREMIVGAYGPPAAAKIFPGAAPDEPVALARFAVEVADSLKKTALPPARIPGASLDVAATATSLEGKSAQLDMHRQDVQREIREAQQTLSAKNSAIADYDTIFSGVATTISGLLRLAGLLDLAAKVRPSARRPGQTAGDAGEVPDPGPPADK